MAATIYLYDSIGWGGISAQDFANTLQQLEAAGETEFVLRVNSPGGSVFDGYAIYNLLKSRNVTVIVDGMAASIASVIALAGKKVTMNNLSMFMIHNPWMMAAGDVNEFLKMGITLDAIGKQIASIYEQKTGKDYETIKAWMDAEKYFTPAEAKMHGFADGIENSIAEKKFVAMYVVEDSISKPNKGEKAVNERLLSFLGLPKDATEDQVNAKLAELRAKMGLAVTAGIDELFAQADSAPSAELLALQATVTKLEAAIAKIINADADAKAEQLVDGAIAAGKILPADRATYLIAAKADFAGVKAQLDAKANGSAVPPKMEISRDEVKPKNLVTAAADSIRAQMGAQK